MKVTLLTLVLVALLGCDNRSRTEAQLSPLFNVCAELREGDSYRLHDAPVVDFDEGNLQLSESVFGVYVGRHPDFDKKHRDMGRIDDRNFMFIGTDLSGSVRKVLLGRRDSEGSLIFVMFSRKGMTDGEIGLLTRRNFVKTCSE